MPIKMISGKEAQLLSDVHSKTFCTDQEGLLVFSLNGDMKKGVYKGKTKWISYPNARVCPSLMVSTELSWENQVWKPKKTRLTNET